MMIPEPLYLCLTDLRRRLEALAGPYERWLGERLDRALADQGMIAAPRLRECVLLADLRWAEGRVAQMTLLAATAEGLGVSEAALGKLRERAAEALSDRKCITQLYLEAWGDVAAA